MAERDRPERRGRRGQRNRAPAGRLRADHAPSGRLVRLTRRASVLPVGSDLEYADEVTLGWALFGRREM